MSRLWLVAQADASMKKGEWKRSTYTGVSLVGKTLSIMGFGKVCRTPTAFIYAPQPCLKPGYAQIPVVYSVHMCLHHCARLMASLPPEGRPGKPAALLPSYAGCC